MPEKLKPCPFCGGKAEACQTIRWLFLESYVLWLRKLHIKICKQRTGDRYME